MLVYLRDGSDQTVLHAAILRKKANEAVMGNVQLHVFCSADAIAHVSGILSISFLLTSSKPS